MTDQPKPYTEDILLSAMETAGKDEFEKETERKGLGTPATRASIIEKLIRSGCAERKKKQILPTGQGRVLVAAVSESMNKNKQREENDMTLAESYLNQFFMLAYNGTYPDFSDPGHIDIVLQLSSDGRHEVRVSVDLVGYEARKYCDRQLVETKSFASLGSMVCQYLSQLDLNELIRLSPEEIERAGRNNYRDCVNAVLQAVVENFDGESLSFYAPEGSVVKFGADCLEYTLATMINRMPDTVSVRPENRVWAMSVTPDVWQTDRFDFLGTIRLESGVRTDNIEFLGPMLSVFADYAREYIDGLRENETRDVIRYAEGKTIDPEKREIYDFADRLDRLEGSFDIMKYLKKMDDRGISCWDNVQHYYDLLAAGDLTEIRELLNTVMLYSDDSDRASMARVMTEELNERERDFSRGTAEAVR